MLLALRSLVEASSGAYSLAGGTGAFTLSGQAASLRRTRVISAGLGAFTFSGKAAGALHIWVMPASAGSFAFTGQAATFSLLNLISLTAETGAFVLTGNAVTLAIVLPPFKRDISASLRRELEKQESPETILAFLTITHPNLNDPIRVVCDPEDFILNGETYIGFLFEWGILSDSQPTPEARLTVQNVDRVIGDTIRTLVGPPRVKIELIAASEFDLTVSPRTHTGTPSVEYLADKLYLVDVEADALQVSGRLVTLNYTQQMWPAPVATQARCPGLYR